MFAREEGVFVDAVAEVFARVLERPAGPDDDVLSLGGDSHDALRIILELERRFDVDLPDELVETGGTIQEIAQALSALVAGPPA